MALPMVISMLVQALYNVVDSIYVSQVSESAVTALSLAFPIQNLLIGFAVGIGVGVNSLLSKSLGEKNQEAANRAAGNGIVLMAIAMVLFVLFGLFGVRPICHSVRQPGDRGGRHCLHQHLLRVQCRLLRIHSGRAAAAIHRPYQSGHVHPAVGRHHQHRHGPHSDLWPVAAHPGWAWPALLWPPLLDRSWRRSWA